jgi:bifunctional DNA primase/polymerase-like protein
MARDFNRDWAMRMAEAGLAVFPCGDDKRPLIKWREFSSSDAEAIAQLWRQFPGAPPAIDLEKCDLFVLDGDRHGGPDGRAALRKLLKEQGFDYRTAPSALTPNDGVHVYLGQNGHELGNARGKLPAGIDVRGCGGQTRDPAPHQHGDAVPRFGSQCWDFRHVLRTGKRLRWQPPRPTGGPPGLHRTQSRCLFLS